MIGNACGYNDFIFINKNKCKKKKKKEKRKRKKDEIEGGIETIGGGNAMRNLAIQWIKPVYIRYIFLKCQLDVP